MRWSLNSSCGKFHSGNSLRSNVIYKSQKVGLFVPDLIAFNSVIVDAKVVDRITDHERDLMLNYLRITNLRVGVIVNFKHRKLEWERIVL
jgi:GxxExxY protein